MGWSQEEMAEHMGLSVSMVGLLERGKRGIGLETAFAIEDLTIDWEHGPIEARDWCAGEAA